MPEGYPLALDHVHAHRGGVEQDVDDVVLQQVDLIDVEYRAVCPREYARVERLLPVPQRLLDVERPHHHLLGGVERQGDDPHPRPARGERAFQSQVAGAVAAEGLDVPGVARERTVGHHIHLGEEVCQRPCERGLGRAPPSPYQHAADLEADRVQQQGELHLLLADHGREGINAFFSVQEPPLPWERTPHLDVDIRRYLNI